MEEKVAKAIMKIREHDKNIKALLLTGHSLGGAVSQVFYAASFTQAMG